MSVTLYDVSAPVFVQGLKGLLGVLEKAKAHVAARAIDPSALLAARLYPDMFPLTRQVQIAADFAKGAGARLAGHDVPAWEDTEKTFAELKLRIKKTLTFIDSLPQSDIEDSAARAITTGSGEKTRHFTGQNYLLHYALPHFFFHATTAYDILRHNGLEIGKKDFIGVIPQ